MKVLLLIMLVLCVIGYLSLKNNKYAGIRKVLPTISIFIVCILVAVLFIDIVRYQVGFGEFFRGVFSGF